MRTLVNDETKLNTGSFEYSTPEKDSSFRLFGDRLKYAMSIRGISCQDLAQLTFNAKSTIVGYRSGRRSPNVAELRTIARILNVSLDYLLGLKDEPEKLYPD
jgi:transcriptional regulator with XRE-family HTH domain